MHYIQSEAYLWMEATYENVKNDLCADQLPALRRAGFELVHVDYGKVAIRKHSAAQRSSPAAFCAAEDAARRPRTVVGRMDGHETNAFWMRTGTDMPRPPGWPAAFKPAAPPLSSLNTTAVHCKRAGCKRYQARLRAKAGPGPV